MKTLFHLKLFQILLLFLPQTALAQGDYISVIEDSKVEETIRLCKSETILKGLTNAKSKIITQVEFDKLNLSCQTCCDEKFNDEFNYWNRCTEVCNDIHLSDIQEY